MTPDRATFERDLAAAPFLEGAARGRWSLTSVEWPFAVFSMATRDGRSFQLRLDVTGYPAQPPTGGLWDAALCGPPAESGWPKGDISFASVFRRDWQNGTALYMPLDRVSLNGHHDWPASHPHLMWQPELGIVQYLAEVHRLLNGKGYHGTAG
jgi:hypothetical protein